MKPVIDQSFWSDPDIESQPSPIKLAAIWLISNSRTSLLGICGASPLRFQFETGLDPKVLEEATNALPRSFRRFGDVIFVCNYIRYQFGTGDKLTKNNFFVSLRSLFASVKDAALSQFILEEYPEFGGESRQVLKHLRDHTVAAGLRLQILERDEHICLFTGEQLSPDELEADHVIPRAKGGKTIPENLMAVSEKMNTLKKDKDLEVFCAEQGFDFERVSKTILARASKPLLGLSKPKIREEKEGEGRGSGDKKGSVEGKRTLPAIPEKLSELPSFETHWKDFIQHRTQIKKPLTQLAAERILSSLLERPGDAIFALETAIRRGWQGIEWAWIDKEKPRGAPSIRENIKPNIIRSEDE